MRLSEAIKLGAMNGPQAFGALHRNGGSCALGAAGDAVGIQWDMNDIDAGVVALHVNFPTLLRRTTCPVSHGHNGVADIMVRLNDLHGWTRERIADWVETVERSLEDDGRAETDKRVVSDSKLLTPSQRDKELSSC